MSWLTERLATRMRERELTVDALARQLAVERSRLNAIIAGAALPNDNLTRRLARSFDEDPNEWLVRATKPAADDLTAETPTGFVKVAAVSEIPDGSGLSVTARVKTTGQTGVEMEALTAVSVACLTIYDMVKAVERGMRIEDIHLVEKRGGKSGHFRAAGA